jgi:hypothetical protein
MRNVSVTICLIATGLFSACSKEQPPVSVTEFMENPRLLEATMVRCGQNRTEMKYEVECVNAREAVNRLERAEERERRAHLEAQSERKRKALRATQEAAAAARRRAEEEQRRREEAEYLGIFDAAPGGDVDAVPRQDVGTVPVDVQAAANAPAAAVEPAAEPLPEETAGDDDEVSASDLAAIREELRRRRENPQ